MDALIIAAAYHYCMMQC